jgi:nucleolar pre-ribosomal-associated protein 2
VELEKDSAPFEELLIEAAKFIGVDPDELRSSPNDGIDTIQQPKAGIYHGREEWLLRWLLKKLQAPKDAVPR